MAFCKTKTWHCHISSSHDRTALFVKLAAWPACTSEFLEGFRAEFVRFVQRQSSEIGPAINEPSARRNSVANSVGLISSGDVLS